MQQGCKRYRKLVTTLRVGTRNIDPEVDTGAELSTIPASIYHEKLQRVKLQPSAKVLCQYDGRTLPTMGEIVTEVSHDQQEVEGPFIIAKTNGQLPLLGWDFLYRLSLYWPRTLKRGNGNDLRVHTLHTLTLMNEFPEVTRKGLGLLKGMKAELGHKERVGSEIL